MTKLSRAALKKEIKQYQSYMTEFIDYVDFKKANPYAEKDADFERMDTPCIKQRPEVLNQSRRMLPKLEKDSS